MISGLLSGTETFQQAFRKMAQSVFMDFISAIERMVEQWLIGELFMTSTTATQTAIRTALQAESNKGDIAGLIERAMSSIGTSVFETFAGATAWFSPTLGPAAPAAGAAVAAGMEATAIAGMPAFDIGSWYVPNTGPALIHRGEMVLPAGMAEAIRSGGGGETHIHLHGPVIGTRQWFDANADYIGKALLKHARNAGL